MEDGGNENISKIQSIVDDLRSEDVQVRVKSMKQIKDVATALGPARTKDELLNFLSQLVGDEDNVLEVMAEELGGFVELVGGPEHIDVILEPLEQLCVAQDSKVREAALRSCEEISKSLSPELVHQKLYPFAMKMATADWFTGHVSATFLFPVVYPTCSDEHKVELKNLYKTFVSNNSPAVRRAAASNLAKFISSVENVNIMSELFPLFQIVSTDEQDSVRFSSVDSCISLGLKFTPEETREHLLPTVINLAKDSSWRVRYMVAEKYVNLAKSLGAEITRTEMVGHFINLLKDSEAVVRTAASSKVTEFSELVPEDTLLDVILPTVSILVSDESHQVRSALASNIMGMAPLLGREKTISHLLDLFLKLLKDAFPEVRLNIISKLESVNMVIGLELLSQSLLPAIIELAEDLQWRVRLAIINYIPLLASQLGPDFFDERLINLCMSWLSDPIYSIRDASINNLKRLVEIFGIAWGEEKIFPRIIVLYNLEKYLPRMTSLFSINSLVPIVGSAVLENLFIPLLLKMSTDPVPNIRFNVAQTLQLAAKYVDAATVDNQIKPTLNTLLEDSDVDVKYYAYMALQAIGS